MIRPIKVAAMEGYKIRVAYSDGTVGVMDLSDTVGKGVFQTLKDTTFFNKVYIGDHGQIAWSDEIEICPDAAYLEMTEKDSPGIVHA